MTTDPAPPIMRAAFVARPPAETFAVFTDEIGAWWPLPSHGIFGAESGGVHFHDGRLIEQAVDGRQATWAEVLEWEAPERLVLAWHPGGGPPGRVEITFRADNGGTEVRLTHSGWEVFGQDAMDKRRTYIGPSAWGHVLDHLADGAEARTDGADLTELAAAYEAFFAEAHNDGFGTPTDGGWTGPQVIAHVALNDLAMTAVAQSLVHRGQPTFENHTCQVVANLDAVVDAHGDHDSLVAFGRRCATQAMAAAGRLDPEQRSTMVQCRLEHDGATVHEGALPWTALAIETQATRHLPAHVEQLQKLRIG